MNDTDHICCVFCEETLHIGNLALFDWLAVKGVPKGLACSVVCRDAFRVRQALQDPGSVQVQIRMRPDGDADLIHFRGVTYRKLFRYTMFRHQANAMIQFYPHVFEEI